MTTAAQPSFALIAALPRELARLTARTRPDVGLLRQGIALFRLPNAIAVAAGMGRERVALAVEAALRACAPDCTLVSVGLAGACTGDLEPGRVVEASTVVDALTGERYAAGVLAAEEPRPAVLVSTDTIASVAEKARLAAAYGASLVDMEAATVARLARTHGLRFRAIKGVSDAHDFELAGLAQFTGRRGEFRTARFALHTALRPQTWRGAMALGRHSNLALAAMAERLEHILSGTA